MSNILSIEQADCRNCNKCVRACPVKAIAITKGQARVVSERCIMCGTCLSVCPQGAKKVQSDLSRVKEMITAGGRVVASIAPSFVAHFTSLKESVVLDSIIDLGFCHIEETAVGARAVSDEYSKLLRNTKAPVISSCCPSVNLYIEKYYPELTTYLAPVVSPMVAHARIIKHRWPSAKVVFIGPCLAKMVEGREECNADIDAVLTFAELESWLNEEKMFNSPVERDQTVDNSNLLDTRSYPIAGGLIHTIEPSVMDNIEIAQVSGFEELDDICSYLMGAQPGALLIEANMCNGGCINGPYMNKELSIYERRENVSRYSKTGTASPQSWCNDGIDFSRAFEGYVLHESVPSEWEIREILNKMGKTSPAEEINCGACGYDSCRQKAIAVCRGRAELEMCMPYMQKRAESMANLIIENTSNAILVMDDELNIREANPAAEMLFEIPASQLIGFEVSKVMPVATCLYVRNTKKSVTNRRVALDDRNKTILLTVTYVRNEKALIVVMTDITAVEKQASHLATVRKETIEKGQEVIKKQMRVVHEIAGLLGETAAESKALLTQLINLVESGSKE